MRLNKIHIIGLSVTLSLGLSIANAQENENEVITSRYFDKIKQQKDNAKLTLFCSMMPKGGDIHHHYSGAMYAETYFDWGASKGMMLNTNTFLLTQGPCGSCVSIDSLKKNGVLYRKVLDTWSDMDFSSFYHEQDQPDQHFFNTFSYFGNISWAYYKKGLQELKARAGIEHVQYIETMLMSPSVPVTFTSATQARLLAIEQKKDSVTLAKVLDSLVTVIAASSKYEPAIQNYIDSLYSYHSGIDDSSFTMRFQAYVSRNANPDALFAKLYGCFDAVSKDKSSLIVGVNIVSPENGIISMRDYWLHMHMFAYLKNKFKNTKTAMHAGELCMGLVKPEDLTYHVNDAIYTAHANRIGHGVDIPYETEALDVLKKMHDQGIAIEINLTSNEFILGVKGNDHPVMMYYDAGVPIVISTDDAGVSRNNLTTEYVKLVSRYPFGYEQIKSFVYNSIEYSFLLDKDKVEVKKQLDYQFKTFETEVASGLATVLK